MSTIFMAVMAIGDVSQGVLDEQTALQYIALGMLFDSITSVAAIAVYINL